MRCGVCDGDNEPGARFCGFCGSPFPDYPTDGPATTVLDRSTGNNGSPADAGQAWAPERAAAPPAQPMGRERSPHARLPGLATTRWLCAAVTIDAELERRILDEVLEEQQRAVITTPGVDLVTVLKYALAAHRRRLVRDVVLLLDLCALIVSVLFLRSFPAFVVLLIVAWGTVFVHRYIAEYGAPINGLRADSFDPKKVHSPPRGSFADQQLQRIAATGTTGNITLYSGFAPFRGYGTARSSWSFAIDITRPPQSMTRPGLRGQPRAFSALDVYDCVKAGLLELDLPGIELTDRLFINGRDVHDDPRFVPEPGGPPVTSVTPEVMRQLLVEPEEWARPYLTISSTSWRGDLVVTTFIRFLVSRTDLFVEAAHNVVPPLRAEFKAIDERDPGPDVGEFFALAGRTLLSTLPRLFGSVAGIFHELGAGSRREKKRRRVEETRDYGALVSVRELAADTKWQRYFQIFDDERFTKVIEQRIFRSLVEFLKEHNVDTSSIESRLEMLVNNGVMFGDNANVKESQVGGAGSRLAGLIPRARGEESARSTEGGS
jgi:hypothetical protein